MGSEGARPGPTRAGSSASGFGFRARYGLLERHTGCGGYSKLRGHKPPADSTVGICDHLLLGDQVMRSREEIRLWDFTRRLVCEVSQGRQVMRSCEGIRFCVS